MYTTNSTVSYMHMVIQQMSTTFPSCMTETLYSLSSAPFSLSPLQPPFYFLLPWVASQVALVVKNLSASAGDTRYRGLIPWSGRSPGEGNGNPLQYYCLENPMDKGAWQVTVHSERLPLWAMNDTRILGLWRRGIRSGASDEALPLRAFV